MAKLETFHAAKATVMVIINTIVNMGRLPSTSPRIIIPADPWLLFSSLVLLGGPLLGLEFESVKIAFSESL